MTQEYPQPHKQTRGSFITLYKTRLFTAEQVWDMCHIGRCVEREKVLDELIEWCKVEAKTYSQYYLTESGYDILATFEQKLKELRQGKDGE